MTKQKLSKNVAIAKNDDMRHPGHTAVSAYWRARREAEKDAPTGYRLKSGPPHPGSAFESLDRVERFVFNRILTVNTRNTRQRDMMESYLTARVFGAADAISRAEWEQDRIKAP